MKIKHTFADPSLNKAVLIYNEALASCPLNIQAHIEKQVDAACVNVGFVVSSMKSPHQDIAKAITLGIMLRMYILQEKYPDTDATRENG